jgi:hypothetical protein
MKLYELNIKSSSFHVLTQALLKIEVFCGRMWHCVVQCIVSSSLKNNSALTSRLKESQKNQLFFLDLLTLQMKAL